MKLVLRNDEPGSLFTGSQYLLLYAFIYKLQELCLDIASKYGTRIKNEMLICVHSRQSVDFSSLIKTIS